MPALVVSPRCWRGSRLQYLTDVLAGQAVHVLALTLSRFALPSVLRLPLCWECLLRVDLDLDVTSPRTSCSNDKINNNLTVKLNVHGYLLQSCCGPCCSTHCALLIHPSELGLYLLLGLISASLCPDLEFDSTYAPGAPLDLFLTLWMFSTVFTLPPALLCVLILYVPALSVSFSLAQSLSISFRLLVGAWSLWTSWPFPLWFRCGSACT